MAQNVNFDNQAEHFDRRAGLPTLAGRAIAEAITGMMRADAGAMLVEIGAGTGQIGEHLLELPYQYIGVDISAPMLEVFRERVSPDAPNLMALDANQRWPVDDRSTSIIFSSRTLHLLDREHVVREFFRVAAPAGAALVSGRARRDASSVQAEMRKQMRKFLQESGVEGRAGERNLHALFDACCEAGARRIEPRVAHRWTAERSPLESIESWQGKDGLAGVAVSKEVKRIVLDRLHDWAVERFGDLRQSFTMQEEYVLEGISLP